jgi:hypothetical protein
LVSHIEFRLSVFENRVMKKMLGPKRDEVTGEWSRLHSKRFTNQQILFEGFSEET